jgi:hypothetical protein
MTDCTYPTARNVGGDVVLFIYERRRIISLAFGIAAIGLSLVASIFGEHAPDPNRCDPGSLAPFAFTQTASPQTFTLGCPTGLEYTIRW